MPSALEVSRIAKSLNGSRAVDDLSFTVEQGSIYGLLGPNGAGKTTTIRMLMDIIVPDSSSVSIFGQLFRHGQGLLPDGRPGMEDPVR